MSGLRRNQRGFSHLVIPDSHASPDQNNDRFEWLGKLIYDLRPDVVIDIGDSADMDSLCSYDKGTKGYENRRYTKDCEAYQDAMEKLWHPYRLHKKGLPQRVKTRGNHENRISKAESYAGIMEGTFGISDLKENDFNDLVYPFLEPVQLSGIWYNHYCPTPLMGTALSSVNLARAIIKQEHRSTTVGHTHNRGFHEERGVQGLVVGCYMDFTPNYAVSTARNWWSGVVLKTNVEQDRYDHEWISLKRIKDAYA